MLHNIFNQDGQSDYRTVHPVLAQLMKQLLTMQPSKTPQGGGGGPAVAHQLPFAQVGMMPQQQQQGWQQGQQGQMGLLNGIKDLMPLAKQIGNMGGSYNFGSLGGLGGELGGMGSDMPSFFTDIFSSGGGEAAGLIGEEAGSLASMLSFI